MANRAFPDRILIKSLSRSPRTEVKVPGSKSITNRALVLAALASHQEDCLLTGALESEDTEVMIAALKKLGFHVDDSRLEAGEIRLGHLTSDRLIPASDADLFLANSGTSVRFLTALTGLGTGRYRLDGIERMRERPIQDLLDALNQLGAHAQSEGQSGCPPVTVESSGIHGGEVRIRGDVSSQFLSGLLLVAPLAEHDVLIRLESELVSRPYVEMTTTMMRSFGAQVNEPGPDTFHIPGNQRYRLDHYEIEPDASAASYFFAAAAITNGDICVRGLDRTSIQGDLEFVQVLQQMGCGVSFQENGTCCRGETLRGIDVDMNAISDTVMTLAAVACFAKGPTTIRNVGHIRHKETDRLAALANELRSIGAGVIEEESTLTIMPGELHAAEIETYNDHRMAMSFALIGLRVPGIVIKDPKCVSKTYPCFFEDLAALG